MTTVSAGSSATETLSVKSTVTVALDSAERAIVSASRGGVEVSRATVSNGQTVGPFLTGDVVIIEALRGAVDYGITSYSQNSAHMMTDIEGTGITASQAGLLQAMQCGARRHGMRKLANTLQLQTTFGGFTWRIGFAEPSHARSVRVGFLKNASSTWTIDEAYVGSATTGTGALDCAAWNRLTFNDGSTVVQTVPLEVRPASIGGPSVCGHVWSDMVPCPTVDVSGQTYKIIVVSVYSASTNTATCNLSANNATWAGSMPLSVWTAFKTGNLSNATMPTPSVPSASPVMAIEWSTQDVGLSIGCWGDSIDAGFSTSVMGNGWIHEMCAQLTASLGKSVSPYMAGYPGETSQMYLNRFMQAASAGPLPDICIFRPYSRNTGETNIEPTMGRTDAFVAKCIEKRVQPVLACGMYESSVTSNNAIKDNVNTAVIAYAAARGIPVIRFDQVISDGTLLSGDGIHPGDSGNTALATRAAADTLSTVRQLLLLS